MATSQSHLGHRLKKLRWIKKASSFLNYKMADSSATWYKKSVKITDSIASHKLVETYKDSRKGYKRVTPQLFKL